MSRATVLFGLYGPTLDRSGSHPKRWQRWRPSLSLCQHDDLLIDRYELLVQPDYRDDAERLADDIRSVSPETGLRLQAIDFADPWDFEQVYAALYEFAHGYRFDDEREDYLVHISTGTHVAQICCYLLTEARYFPARLIQSSPPVRAARDTHGAAGTYRIIDLDLSRYDQIASRFRREADRGADFLKAGIATRDAGFNDLIARIEQVALRSPAPLLLTGPTGAGKSQLARRIYQLKRQRKLIAGALVEVNCATLRGDAAMSTLFGHIKGAFTGAARDRDGLLRAADGGLLFLDEIGELGGDEQTMLLRALEDKRFLPLGADRESASDFVLIAGSNRDLAREVASGRFREDLLARINLWTFRLPGLAERRDDIEPNLDYELDRYAREHDRVARFSADARRRYMDFALSPAASWRANFRDLAASVTRMATLAADGRIDARLVDEEITRLRANWHDGDARYAEPARRRGNAAALDALIPDDIDRFDAVQLRETLRVCCASRSLAEAGRTLFAASRRQKKAANDSDRLRKYLARFGLDWQSLKDGRAGRGAGR